MTWMLIKGFQKNRYAFITNMTTLVITDSFSMYRPILYINHSYAYINHLFDRFLESWVWVTCGNKTDFRDKYKAKVFGEALFISGPSLITSVVRSVIESELLRVLELQSNSIYVKK